MPIDLRSIGGPPKASPPKQSSAGATVKHFVNTTPSLQTESDALHFTDAGAILRNAERLVATLPVVDASRVSSISASIDQGSYIVDAERVAEKIIELEQDLAG